MPTRIGNRSYPAVSEGQRNVMSGLLNDPGWGKLLIGNRSYANDPASVARPDETTGQAPPAPAPNAISSALQQYAAGLGKTANDLTLPELNEFIGRYGGPVPKTMYTLPRNY